MNFSDLIDAAFNGVTYRTKRNVYVPMRLGRDCLGRFTGRNRAAYSYPIYDKSQPVTRKQLIIENISQSNALLRKTLGKEY